MATRRTKVALPVSPKAPPDQEGLLAWFKKEGHQLLIQIRDVINNLSDLVDGITSDTYKVKVDASGTPDYLEGKLADSATVTWEKVADQMVPTAIATVPPGIYDPPLYRPGPLTSGETIWAIGFSRACTIPANFAGGRCILLVAPLTGLTVTVKYTPWGGAASTLGTITFAASATTGTISTSAQAAAVDGLLTFHNQAVADAEAAGLVFWTPVTRT